MKKSLYILGGIILLFIITNPSISAFKAYIGSNTYSGLKRTTNLFVCSIYKHNGVNYFGVVGNFFDIQKSNEVKNTLSAPKVDSTEKTIIDSTEMRPDTSKYTSDGLPILRKK
ncbi:hypothetical protein HDF19_10085 [Mucilaginibacter sp. E4BP6]|uniref:hypothetical protein n=1 Tax=Mucilaginibacter sp. E4BP6 TaxID=2723089 RepID=UPI003B00206C